MKNEICCDDRNTLNVIKDTFVEQDSLQHYSSLSKDITVTIAITLAILRYSASVEDMLTLEVAFSKIMALIKFFPYIEAKKP